MTFKGAIIEEENYAHICLDVDAAAKYEKSDAEVRRQIKVFKNKLSPTRKSSYHFMISFQMTGRPMTVSGTNCPKKKTDALENTRSFRNYPFSVVKAFDLELEDAVEVFQRINQAGKRLTCFDLGCRQLLVAIVQFGKIGQRI